MSMKKRCKNMGVLLLLLFSVTSVYSLEKPHCNVSSESTQRVHSSAVCQSGCEDGWYGDHCRRRCLKFCVKCDRVTGNCSGHCKHGYFGDDCFSRCDHCSAGCDAKGECIKSTITIPSANIDSCPPGWFGPKCQLECKNCNKYGCLKQTGACLECRNGYYGTYCSDRCPENCNLNYNNNNKSPCSRDSGQCLHGCVKGWFGDRCKKKCSLGCRNGTCNNMGTKCSEGCIDGRYGDTCNKKCSKNCIKQLCENDGTCLEGCNPGWTGSRCLQNSHKLEDRCSENCNDSINKSSCNPKTGQCLYGCVKGWVGDRCETKCSKNCIKQICENDGTCLEGCSPGWTGSRCLQNSPKLEGYATQFELIIGFTTVILFLVVLLACVILKNRKNAEHKEPNSAPESVSLSGNTSTVTDHYDQINESQLESFSDISSNNSEQSALCFNNNNSQIYLHPIVEDVFIPAVS